MTLELRDICEANGCNKATFLATFCSDHKCGVRVYWWEGEYDGECERIKDHKEPYHYDGISYFNDDNEEVYIDE